MDDGNQQQQLLLQPTSAASVERLLSRMKLLPLIESCETVWPSRLDMQLILPSYEEDLLKLRTALEGNPSLLLLHQDEEEEDEDVLDFQILFICCCYESTAFILCEDLADVQQVIRVDHVWGKLMRLPTRKSIVTHLFKYYRKVLLREDWFYHFGDLSSFWGFVWDLLDYDVGRELIDRDAVELVELVCFRLMGSQSIQLFVKGVMVMEECVHKIRGSSLVNYELVYEELSKHTWRLDEDDERNQQGSIVLLAAMSECVRVLEVERNQLMTLIQNFTHWSRADTMMEVLLEAVRKSTSIGKSIFLMENILLLLTMDQEDIFVTPTQDGYLPKLEGDSDEANQLIPFSLQILTAMGRIDFKSPHWYKEITSLNKGRFHRWTRKIIRLLTTEIDKFENSAVTYFQYLCCVFLFSTDCPSSKILDEETASTLYPMMITFVQKLVTSANRQLVPSPGQTKDSTTKRCLELVAAVLTFIKHYGSSLATDDDPEVIATTTTTIVNRQQRQLNRMSQMVERWVP